MECRSQKSFAIDVRERSHRSAIADAQEVEVARMLAILREHRDGIETRTIMMELPFEPPVLGGKNKIPVTPRTSVVTPVWDGGVVTEDGVESHLSLVLVIEVFHPRVHFFLTSGVPGHLAAERVGLGLPAVGACLHPGVEIRGFRGHALAFEVGQNLNKDAALHLAENGKAVSKFGHRQGCFIGMREIPVPGMVGDQALVVARQAIQHPVGGSDVRIVVGPIHSFGRFHAPAGPTAPIEIAAIVIRRQLIGLIVEQTLAHAIWMWAVPELQAAPEHAIHELLNLVELFVVGLAQLFHDGREPGTRAALITQASNPHTAVLRNDLVGLAFIAHDRGATMEGILRIDKPLLGGQKTTHVCDGLRGGLDHKILDGLN